MEKEINEVSVEINSIFDNMSIDVLNKIPLKIRNFFKNNASSTYIFEYDQTKRLNEQNIKDKTRGIIALLYRDYICNEAERKQYNEIYSEFLNKNEEEKRALYNPDDLFKKDNISSSENSSNHKVEKHLEIINNKPNFIKRFFNKIIVFFKHLL